ncbi:NUDIX domain-containing protein [Chaetomium fimeti]|uniref:NUDIX domain-containing protein n=1 Tax=Chaetomium fimeti TaxID=1854472 RepID=A0AAE0LR05_9PEZI|nr:NUDIX domain-containing protein [Chaetomium fimeti]
MPSAVPAKVIGSRQGGTAYTERSAVRVIVTSSDGGDSRVVLVKARKENYYKLPGGGVDEGEDYQKAAEREVLEETGFHVSVEGEYFATTEEFRNDLHQISYCYRARLLDEAGKPNLTEEELADGLSHEWVPVENALQIMLSVEPTSELGLYIKERDMFLLAEALRSN